MRIDSEFTASPAAAGYGPMTPAPGGDFAAALNKAASSKRDKAEQAAEAAATAAETAARNQREKAEATRADHAALVKELRDYLNKSPAEHLRDTVLKELGLTEEKLAAMPPEQRQAAEAEINRRIREHLAGKEHDRDDAGQAAAVPLGIDDTPGTAAADPRTGYDRAVAIFRSINAGQIPT